MTEIEQLKMLYRTLYAHTSDLCKEMCNRESKWRCCSKEYCEIARKYTFTKYGIVLEDVNEEIPFMGEHGCILFPHLRPTCTKYHCRATGIGPYPDGEWTKTYFKLKKEIERIETK